MSDAQEPQAAPETPAETVSPETSVTSEPAEPSSDAPTEGSIPDSQESAPEPSEENRGFRRRVGRLTDELRATQAELAQLRQQQTQVQQKPAEAEPAPRREDFEDYEEFIEARIAHRMRGEMQTMLQHEQQQREQQAQMAQWQEVNNTWMARQDKARERYADFDEVAKSHDHIVSDAMAQTIVQHEMGPDIAYYLGKNPSESAEISRLPQLQAAAELGRIAERLKVQQSAPKRRSAAPPPAEPGRGAAVQASPNALSDEMSMSDWQKMRAKQVHGR